MVIGICTHMHGVRSSCVNWVIAENVMHIMIVIGWMDKPLII